MVDVGGQHPRVTFSRAFKAKNYLQIWFSFCSICTVFFSLTLCVLYQRTHLGAKVSLQNISLRLTKHATGIFDFVTCVARVFKSPGWGQISRLYSHKAITGGLSVSCVWHPQMPQAKEGQKRKAGRMWSGLSLPFIGEVLMRLSCMTGRRSHLIGESRLSANPTNLVGGGKMLASVSVIWDQKVELE